MAASQGDIRPDPNNPRHKAFIRLVLAARDWRASYAAVQHIRNYVSRSEDPLFLSLAAATVVCYARPFLPGRNGGRISGAFERFDNSDFLDLQRVLLDYRNKAVAHSNLEQHKVTLWPKGSVLEFGGHKTTLASHSENVWGPVLNFEVVPHVDVLICFQQAGIKMEIERQKEELFPSNVGPPDTSGA